MAGVHAAMQPDLQLMISTKPYRSGVHTFSCICAGYPPLVRRFHVYYDYTNRRARIDESADPGRVLARASVKRYDLAFEFEVRELSEQRSCRKSRVREAMPPPLLPRDLVYLGTDTVSAALLLRAHFHTCVPPSLTRCRTLHTAGMHNKQVHGIAADRWRDLRGVRARNGGRAQPSTAAESPSATKSTGDRQGALPSDWAGVEVGDEVVDLWFASDSKGEEASRTADPACKAAIAAAAAGGAAVAGGCATGASYAKLLRMRSETVTAVVHDAAGSDSEGGAHSAAQRAVQTTPLMTWDLLSLKLGTPPESAFTLAGAAGAAVFSNASDAEGAFARAAGAVAAGTPPLLVKAGLNVSGCERLPLDIGFPYMHILHSYIYA